MKSLLIMSLQFNKALEVKFDETGTHVVDLPVDKCRCPPPPPPQDCCVFRKVGNLVTQYIKQLYQNLFKCRVLPILNSPSICLTDDHPACIATVYLYLWARGTAEAKGNAILGVALGLFTHFLSFSWLENTKGTWMTMALLSIEYRASVPHKVTLIWFIYYSFGTVVTGRVLSPTPPSRPTRPGRGCGATWRARAAASIWTRRW